MDKFFPPQTFKAAGVLAARVSLDQVRIKDASFQSSGDWTKIPSVNTDSVTHTITPGAYSFDEKANAFDVEIDFIAILEGKKANAPSFKVQASFIARYHLTTTNPPPPDMREMFFGSFSKVNALLNVWPYWREFVSSCNDRMGLPHWNLPVLRLMPEPPTPSIKEQTPPQAHKKTPAKKVEPKAKK